MKRITCALVAALAVAAPLRAAETNWEGKYEFTSVGSTDVGAAIEQTVAKMSFIKRPIARSRLKQTNPTYKNVSISRAGDQITIAFDARKPVTTRIDGSFVKWTRDDGEVFDVAIRPQSDLLIQTFKAADGERMNAFRSVADELHMDVVIKSEQPPAPLKYTLRYRRVP